MKSHQYLGKTWIAQLKLLMKTPTFGKPLKYPEKKFLHSHEVVFQIKVTKIQSWQQTNERKEKQT